MIFIDFKLRESSLWNRFKIILLHKAKPHVDWFHVRITWNYSHPVNIKGNQKHHNKQAWPLITRRPTSRARTSRRLHGEHQSILMADFGFLSRNQLISITPSQHQSHTHGFQLNSAGFRVPNRGAVRSTPGRKMLQSAIDELEDSDLLV